MLKKTNILELVTYHGNLISLDQLHPLTLIADCIHVVWHQVNQVQLLLDVVSSKPYKNLYN